VLLFLLGIIDRFSWYFSEEVDFFRSIDGLKLAGILAMIMMLHNGTFRNTIFYKIALIFIFSFVLGVVFKIMHLTGADALLLISFPVILVLYFIHFLKKEKKTALDYLKLLTLLFFVSITPLGVAHVISYDVREIMGLIYHLLLWTTFILFIVEGYKKEVLF
jgi:hypothetical protein